jgi:hypothetical protein
MFGMVSETSLATNTAIASGRKLGIGAASDLLVKG